MKVLYQKRGIVYQKRWKSVFKMMNFAVNAQKSGLKFSFKNPDEAFGTARTLFVTNDVTFDMLCHTGQCVPMNQALPPEE